MKFLKVIGAISLAGAISVLSLLTFKKVPDRHPLICKYETNESKYTLVHIKQRHKKLDEKETITQCKRTIYIQNEIYQILRGFVKEGITNIYLEGLTDLLKDDYLTKISELRQKNSLTKSKVERNRILFEHGAAPLLALEGLINVRESENFITHLDAILFFSMPNTLYDLRTNQNEKMGEFFDRIIFETRENELLEIIANRYGDETNKLHVAVYGAGHTWRDNIEKWNINNPDKKFSLIEITPYNLRK